MKIDDKPGDNKKPLDDISPKYICDIPMLSAMFLRGDSTSEKAAAWLEKTCPYETYEALVCALSDEELVKAFERFRENLENSIRNLIAEKLGDTPIPVGTSISFEKDGRQIEGTITNVRRLEEDLFHTGWYAYVAVDDSGHEHYLLMNEITCDFEVAPLDEKYKNWEC